MIEVLVAFRQRCGLERGVERGPFVQLQSDVEGTLIHVGQKVSLEREAEGQRDRQRGSRAYEHPA